MTESKKKKNTRKLKQECGFIYYIAHNPHVDQSKNFLKNSIKPSQYLVLRELAVNELAQNIPLEGGKKRRVALLRQHRQRLKRLAEGKLRKRNLHHVYPLIRLLCQRVLDYHGLCN